MHLDVATASIITAVIGSGPLGVLIGKFYESRSTRENTLEQRVTRLEEAANISADYVQVLRTHIVDGKPPPPPPYPEGMRV